MMKYRWWAAVAVLSALFTTRAHAQQSADLTGRVLYDTANAGVSRVTVTLLPGTRRAGTDAEGRFRFGNVPAGDYVLRIASAGYTASDVRVRISSGSNNTVELRVARITRLAPVAVRDSRVNFSTRAGNLGSRTDVPSAELPFSVQTVGRDLLDERQQITIREGVRMLPGVLPGRSATNELVIRGLNDNGGVQSFSAFGSNFAVNGMKNFAGGYESDVLLVNTERIEVVKGASGVLYGFNHPGGLINIVTKRPTDTPLRRLSLSGGTWGRFRAEGDISGQLTDDGRLKYRVSAGYFTSPDWRQAFFNRTVAVAPVVTFDISPTTRGSLEMVFSRTNRTAWFDWGIPARDGADRDITRSVSTQYSSAQLGDAAVLGTAAAFATVSHDISSSLLWTTEASLGNNTIDHQGHYPQFSRARPDSVGNVGLQYRLYNGENAGIFATTYLAKQTSLGRTRHRIVAGVDMLNGDTRGRESSASNNTANPTNVAPMNVFAPEYSVRPIGNYTFTGGYTSNVRTRQLGFYAQDFIDVGARLKLLAGLRRDRFRTREEIGAPDGENTPLLWNLGATIALPQRTMAYASATSSFQPQVVTDPTAGGPFDALTGRQIEAGVRSETADGSFRGGVNVYRIERRNQLVSANDTSNENLLKQIGVTLSDGVEFELAGRASSWLNLQGWYAFNFARPTVSDDASIVGKRLPNAPAHSGAVWARLAPTSGSLKPLAASLGVTAVSSRFGAFDRSQYSGYTVVDAGLSWRANGAQVGVNLNNLLNTRYLSGIWSDFYAQRGAPRNLLVRLSLDL